MKILVLILIALLCLLAIKFLVSFVDGTAESKDSATPFLPNLICFPKKQFGGQFKEIKDKIRNLGGAMYPIPGNNMCFEINPRSFSKIKSWGYEVKGIR